MKKNYAAPTLESSEKALIKFEEKWKSKYNYAIKSWKNNFAELVTLFNFPQKIRKLIYTTNVIENLNKNIRKISKNKTSFPTENSLAKIVYLAIENQVKKWNSRIPNWGIILNQLMILFEDRFQ